MDAFRKGWASRSGHALPTLRCQDHKGPDLLTNMENENRAHEFIKREVLKMERNSFAVRIISAALGYAGVTFWLNAIRANAQLWFVWVLIIVQFALYFSIFVAGYRRAIVCGFSKNVSFIVFVALTVLGRVNDWELAVIPLSVIVMLMVSARAKNVSDKGRTLLPEHSNENN